jgi:hypothetical protein
MRTDKPRRTARRASSGAANSISHPHLKPEGQLHFFVAASGGTLRPIEPGPRSLFAKSASGFAVLEVKPESVSVAFIDVSGQELYRCEVGRGSSTPH